MKKCFKNSLFVFSGIVLFMISVFGFSFDAISDYFGGGGAVVSSLEKGLIFHAPLDGEHLAKDVTPYGNDGTVYGAVLSDGIKGESEGSYAFDGTDDYIDLTTTDNLDITGSFTISLYAKIDVIKTWATPIMKGYQSTNKGYGLLVGSGSIYGGINDGTNKITTPSVELSIGEYHHVVFSVDRDTTETEWLTIDGVKTSTTDISVVGNISNTYQMFIGKNLSGSVDYYNGSLSDVRIYNRVLSTDEITLLYDSYRPKISTSSLEKGLVGHWALDNITGAEDLSGEGNNGTGAGGIIIGGATDRKGLAGKTTSFDGSSDNISIISPNTVRDDGEPMTVGAWVYWNGEAGYQDIVAQRNRYNWIFYIHADNHELSFHGNSQYRSSYVMPQNEWKYVVATVTAGGVSTIYVNGVVVDTHPNYVYHASTTSNLRIGSTGTNEFFNGSIADVRIYNRALSQDEITLLYNQYKPKGSSNVGSLNKGLVLDMPLTTKHTKVGSNIIITSNDRNFESGIIGNWSWTSPDVGSGVVEYSSDNPNTGDRCAKITITDADYGRIKIDSVDLTNFIPEKLYRFGMDVYLPSGHHWTSAVIGLSSFTDSVVIEEDNKIDLTKTDQWQKTSTLFRISTDTIGYIFLQVYGEDKSANGDIAYIDNIFVKEIKTSDRTPYGNDGTVYGAIVGSEYTSFDGTNDYIDLGYLTTTNDFTLCFWLEDKGTNKTWHLFSKNPNADTWSHFGVCKNAEDKIQFSINEEHWDFSTWTDITNGDFLCFTGNTAKLLTVYKNGELLTSHTYSNAFSNSGAGDTSIGRAGEYVNYYFDGELSGIKLYNRAITSDEVKLLYDKGRH